MVSRNFSDIKQQVLYGSIKQSDFICWDFFIKRCYFKRFESKFPRRQSWLRYVQIWTYVRADTISESVEDKIGIDTILLDPDVTPSEVKLRVSSQNHLDLELTIGTQSKSAGRQKFLQYKYD